MKQGVYAIRNKVNGFCYVGATIAISKRFAGHMGRLRKGTHQNKKLQPAYNEFGEVFELVILEECPRHQHREREKWWIAHLNSCDAGYNSTPIGAGPDPETREKIRQSLRDRPRPLDGLLTDARSDEGRKRRSETMRRLNQEGKTGGKWIKANKERLKQQ